MLAKEVVAAVVPSGDVVFVEAAWDALLRSAYKHVAIRCDRPVARIWKGGVHFRSQLSEGSVFVTQIFQLGVWGLL